jgi:L-threonylcarbamoyladenylate synthase
LKPSIETYAELLKQGSIVAFPTETVYGLGASAWNPQAIGKVFEAKKRPADNPLIVHVSSVSMLGDFAEEIPFPARQLMQKFWPGPLTLIFRKKKKVLDLITAGLDTVAVRMPDHPLALELIDLAGPLVGPSANTSGRPSPTHPDHIREDFGNTLPVIDGGRCTIGLESTVIDMTSVMPEILRPGAVTPKKIKELTGIDVIYPNDDERSEYAQTGKNPLTYSKTVPEGELPTTESGHISPAPKSPGLKYSHYSPNATIRWLQDGESTDNISTLYLIHGSSTGHSEQSGKSGQSGIPADTGKARTVSFNGDYHRMARELYDWFRKADHEGYSDIAIEPFRSGDTDELIEALKNRIDKAIGK